MKYGSKRPVVLPTDGRERTIMCMKYGELYDGTNHDEALRKAKSWAWFCRMFGETGLDDPYGLYGEAAKAIEAEIEAKKKAAT